MDIFKDETELNITHIQEYDVSHLPMFQKVVDMFEGRTGFQRIVKLGILANMGYSDELDGSVEDGYEYYNCARGKNDFHGSPKPSDRSRDGGSSERHYTSSSSASQLPLHYGSSVCDYPRSPSAKAQAKESNTERRARLLQETKKSKDKAEKKRLKKRKQKEKRMLEKLKKEKANPGKNEEGKNDEQQSASNSSIEELVSAKDSDSSDSSEDEPSDEDNDTKTDSGEPEELDMTSSFVSKAADIAKRKLELKAKPERKEKIRTPEKVAKTSPAKPDEDQEAEKKDSAAPSYEDNVRISTELASIGNRFASAGDFNTAVKYFTDAIKYNPTEFKLFGNRSFCFEKMQQYMKALTDAEVSLTMCPGWVKGLFRKGRALAGLKRYDEAARAFRDVLKLDSSCAEAAQELMRVQITQLMEHGFSREQSSNALIIHGTVSKALEVLSKLNNQTATQSGTFPLAQVANASGVSPVLSASINSSLPQSHGAVETQFKNNVEGLVQNMSDVKIQPTPTPNLAMKTTYESRPQELFPVWVGNLLSNVTEAMLINLFNKVGAVYSVKMLTYKRCAFVNFTKQEHCEEAIRRFHGCALNGMKIAVRYPDRIPRGMGISKSALTSDDLQDEDMGYNDFGGRNAAGGRRPSYLNKYVSNYRGDY